MGRNWEYLIVDYEFLATSVNQFWLCLFTCCLGYLLRFLYRWGAKLSAMSSSSTDDFPRMQVMWKLEMLSYCLFVFIYLRSIKICVCVFFSILRSGLQLLVCLERLSLCCEICLRDNTNACASFFLYHLEQTDGSSSFVESSVLPRYEIYSTRLPTRETIAFDIKLSVNILLWDRQFKSIGSLKHTKF